MQLLKKIFRLITKQSILKYLYLKYKYQINIGENVTINNNGSLYLESREITISDYSDIIINKLLELKSKVWIGKYVEIGADHIVVNYNTSVQNYSILLGHIEIGANCLIGQNVYISSGYHYFKEKPFLLIRDQDMLARANELKQSIKKIIIEDDVWIGKNSVIVNGVTVGKGAIIGANSFVNKDVLPYTVVAGSPAKIISKRLDFESLMPSILYGNNEQHFPYFYEGFDYSLHVFNINKYVKIINKKFILVAHNQLLMNYINLELYYINNINNLIFEFNNQKVNIANFNVKFKLFDLMQNKFIFSVLNLDTKNEIFLKQVYFSND